MNGDQLGDEISAAIIPKLAPQTSTATTIRVKAFGKGIVEETKHGKATWGNTPGGHKISGISGSSMASLVMGYAGYPGMTKELIQTCKAVADYTMENAIVTYDSPPPSPPVLMPPDAWFLNGKISGLVGAGMANKIVQYVGYPFASDVLVAECNTICSHIMSNALVTKGVIV